MKNCFLLLSFLLVLSCGQEPRSPTAAVDSLQPGASQAEIDDALIVDYLNRNNIKAERLESGLYYTVEEAGSSEKPGPNSLMSAHYRGTLLNGKEFDSSHKRGKPYSFKAGGVIKGWSEGIPLYGKGGKGTIFVPSSMGYGSRDMGTIPPNSVLIFEVELVDFK